MSRITRILSPIILTLLSTGFLFAYWPTTIDGELSLVGSDTTLSASAPVAMNFPNGSVLVVFKIIPDGYYFNVIDRFGELVFPEPQNLRPTAIGGNLYDPRLVPDMEGGAYIAWTNSAGGINGVYAQRIDTLGNLLWGNNAVRIFPIMEMDFEVCLNSDGGLLLAVSPEEQGSGYEDVYAQRIDPEGNLLWGPIGIAVSNIGEQAERYPVITSDGAEGCFIVWEDHRTGWPYGDLYAQHYDGDGNQLWDEDMLICGAPWGFKIVSDSLGGFILQAGPMGAGDSNKHFRFNGEGNLLWEQVGLSHYTVANNDETIPGESGYFYLGFKFWYGYWGQRIDLDGNLYWDIYPPNYGAQMAYHQGWSTPDQDDYYYLHPNLYGIYQYNVLDADRE